jgi:hypothetical protein
MGDAYLVSTLLGVLKAQGLMTAKGQGVVRQQCEAGRIQPAVEAVAAVLLSTGMQDQRIPHNTGIRDKLLETTEAAIKEAVKNYHDNGGVLLAKGYARPLELIAEMAKQWLASFSPPIRDKEKLSRFDPEELNHRLSLTAMALRDLLLEASTSDPGGATLVIPVERVEGLCRSGALQMLRVFDDPNDAHHKRVHGDT